MTSGSTLSGTTILRFLYALHVQLLYRFIVHGGLVNSAALVNSAQTLHLSSEHAIPRNLRSWLGSITLARDRPIKHKNLSFEGLLIEGYDTHRLVVAFPFVCKTLEPAARSKMFRPQKSSLIANDSEGYITCERPLSKVAQVSSALLRTRHLTSRPHVFVGIVAVTS